MYDNVASLLKATERQDVYGNILEEYTEREVFVKPRSVYANDFYNAATVGLKPEIVLVLNNVADYEGEKMVLFNGELYTVIRTYQRPEKDALELTLERRLGSA